MRTLCPECGREVPEGSDFCYGCGRKVDAMNPILNDSGFDFVPPSDECPSCHSRINPDDRFCQHCGTQLPENRGRIVINAQIIRPKKLTAKDYVGILLAFIPGIAGFFGFGLFGLGHIWFKRYSRGFMYMALSAVLFYLGRNSYGSFIDTFITITTFMMFFYQLMECISLAVFSKFGDRN